MGLADFDRQLSKLNRQILHRIVQIHKTIINKLSLFEIILKLQNESIFQSLQIQLILVKLTLPVKNFRGLALQVHNNRITLLDHLVRVLLVLLHLIATDVFELVSQLILDLAHVRAERPVERASTATISGSLHGSLELVSNLIVSSFILIEGDINFSFD